jgi:hypothetical protein
MARAALVEAADAMEMVVTLVVEAVRKKWIPSRLTIEGEVLPGIAGSA